MIYERDSLIPLACDVCGGVSAWLSLYSGPRCESHEPGFDQDVATELVLRGWPDTASAYRRVFDR